MEETSKKAPDYVFTWPNLITAIGAIAIYVSVHFLLDGEKYWSLAFITVAGFSDFFDGRLARYLDARGKRGTSRLGELADPIRDKLLAVILFVVSWELTAYLAALEIISALLAYKARQKSGQHTVTDMSKAVTVVQFLASGFIITHPETSPGWLSLEYLFYLLYIFTAVRIYSYLRLIMRQ